jgi:hypothetical protein
MKLTQNAFARHHQHGRDEPLSVSSWAQSSGKGPDRVIICNEDSNTCPRFLLVHIGDLPRIRPPPLNHKRISYSPDHRVDYDAGAGAPHTRAVS